MCKFKKGDLIIATSSTKSGDKSHMKEHIKYVSTYGCGYSITCEWTKHSFEGKQFTMSKSAFKRACEYFCRCCGHK